MTVMGEGRSLYIRVWETAYLPSPQPTLTRYFSLEAKCWLRGVLGEQFPRNV